METSHSCNDLQSFNKPVADDLQSFNSLLNAIIILYLCLLI